MDHSLDSNGDMHMPDAPDAPEVLLAVEMDVDSPSSTSIPVQHGLAVKRSYDVMAGGSDIKEQESMPQQRVKRRLEEEAGTPQQDNSKRPRSQHDNVPHGEGSWLPSIAPSALRRYVRAPPAEERAPVSLDRVSLVGHVLRSIGWSLYCIVTGTKDQEDTQLVAVPIGNKRRAVDAADREEEEEKENKPVVMAGTWPGQGRPSPSPAPRPSRHASPRRQRDMSRGRRREQSAAVQQAVSKARRRQQVQSNWWLKSQRESRVVRETQRVAIPTTLSTIREVSSPAQSPTDSSYLPAPVSRHNAQAHASSVLHGQTTAPPAPAQSSPASHATVTETPVAPAPVTPPQQAASEPKSTPIPQEDLDRYINDWKTPTPKPRKRSMRHAHFFETMTKEKQKEHERRQDQRVDGLIAKVKAVLLDTPEVAKRQQEARDRAHKQALKEQVERRKYKEWEADVNRTAEREANLGDDWLLSRKDRIREQALKEVAAERARKLEEQRAQDAAIAAAIRETEDTLAAQEKAHAGIAKRTRSTDGFKLAGDLNDEWAARIDDITNTSGRGDQKLATTDAGTELKRLTFQRVLADGRRGTASWLDDDAVNSFILGFVNAKNEAAGWNKRTSTTPPLYACLNSSWWSTQRGRPDGLKNWARRQKIAGVRLLDCEKIFLPINTGAHWTLIIISPQAKTIEYLDSLGASGGSEIKAARAWLQLELGENYIAGDWSAPSAKSSQQDNMSDCGVFTCYNALAAALDIPFKNVTAAKMPNARRQLAAVLLNGGFTGVFKI